MVHGKFHIKIQSQIEEIYVYVIIYSLFTACFATIDIKMATKFTDTYYLNSAVTLTSKFQGQMINCLCV